VKRSRRIRLVLIGGLSAGAATSCGPSASPPGAVGANQVFTNNHCLPGVGYYHAPFRAWYSQPYNHFNPQTRRYFFGGQWAALPHESITNVSAPTPTAAQQAQARHSGVTRSGFGSTSHRHSIYS